jgi:hypothetical protein
MTALFHCLAQAKRLSLLAVLSLFCFGLVLPAGAIRCDATALGNGFEKQLKEEQPASGQEACTGDFALGDEGRTGLFVGNNPVNWVDPYGLDYHYLRNQSQLPPGMVSLVYGDTALEQTSAAINNLEYLAWNAAVGFGQFLHWGAAQAVGESDANGLLLAVGIPEANVPESLGTATGLLGDILKGASRCDKVAKAVETGVRFEGLTPEQIAIVQKALDEAGMAAANLLIKGADMPANYFGMTLGDEGFAINRFLMDNYEELVNTLKHEYQHILDRRALGDPGAYGSALEDAARKAEDQ